MGTINIWYKQLIHTYKYQRWNSFWNPDSCENVKEKVRPLEFHIGKLIDPKQRLLDNQ